MQISMPYLSEQGSGPPARPPFVTIEDCIPFAQELVARLGPLGAQRHPLDVRKGVRVALTNNQPSRTIKATSRTYFFDVKTAQTGAMCLVITESRIKEKRRSQIIVFPEEVQAFVVDLREMAELHQQ
jgi:hypothetical protein